MELFKPELGLSFWLLVLFVLLFIVAAKYVWPIILKSVDDRADLIDKGVGYAQEAQKQLENATDNAKKLLTDAQRQQMEILQEAAQMKARIIEEARSAAAVEAKKVMDAAALSIEQSRQAAEEQFRAEVSGFALQIAEKLVRKELSDDKKQKEIVEEMLKQIEKQN